MDSIPTASNRGSKSQQNVLFAVKTSGKTFEIKKNKTIQIRTGYKKVISH
jgi:hypothetical protein